MKWGPNDTGHIVWALGEFLFMFFFGDSLFFKVYIHYNIQLCTMELEVSSKENGPKQRQSCHLGSR